MLSTIHKAKGLENDRIFFLCPELIPSKYATQPWQYEQEANLKYVAITRAKQELIYVWTNIFNNDIKGKVYL
jgi:superfamily I DNA/RNA helicase